MHLSACSQSFYSTVAVKNDSSLSKSHLAIHYKKHVDLLFQTFMPQMMSTVEKLTKVHNKSRLFPFLMVMENVAVSSWSRIWPG